MDCSISPTQPLTFPLTFNPATRTLPLLCAAETFPAIIISGHGYHVSPTFCTQHHPVQRRPPSTKALLRHGLQVYALYSATGRKTIRYSGAYKARKGKELQTVSLYKVETSLKGYNDKERLYNFCSQNGIIKVRRRFRNSSTPFHARWRLRPTRSAPHNPPTNSRK